MQIIIKICSLLLLVILATYGKPNKKHHNTCDFDNIQAGDNCKIKWMDLKNRVHPTQAGIGMAWVARELKQHFDNPFDAQDYLNEKIVPVVKGINNDVWLLDHHHLLSALDYTGYGNAMVSLYIVCDFTSKVKTINDFWKLMQKENYVYPFSRPKGDYTSLPTQIDTSQIPKVLIYNSTMTWFLDDPWRSLASYIRKLPDNDDQCDSGNKYCMRGYTKSCNNNQDAIPYVSLQTDDDIIFDFILSNIFLFHILLYAYIQFEFRWGYFFNAGYKNISLWKDPNDFQQFQKQFLNLKFGDVNVEDLDAWYDVAETLFPFARSKIAGTFNVPLYQIEGILPGWFNNGNGPIPYPDPDCNKERCH